MRNEEWWCGAKHDRAPRKFIDKNQFPSGRDSRYGKAATFIRNSSFEQSFHPQS